MKVTIISHHAPALLRVISYNRSRRPTWSCWPGCWTSSATRRSSSGRSSPTCSPGATTPSTSSITPQEGLTSTSSLSLGHSLGDHYRWSWSCCQRPSWCCKPGTHAAPSATFASWSTSGSTRNLTSQCLRYILALIVSIVARAMMINDHDWYVHCISRGRCFSEQCENTRTESAFTSRTRRVQIASISPQRSLASHYHPQCQNGRHCSFLPPMWLSSFQNQAWTFKQLDEFSNRVAHHLIRSICICIYICICDTPYDQVHLYLYLYLYLWHTTWTGSRNCQLIIVTYWLSQY